MAEGINTPSKFYGLNFSMWKVKITVFLQSLGSRVLKAMVKPFMFPETDEDTLSDIILKEFELMLKLIMHFYKF